MATKRCCEGCEYWNNRNVKFSEDEFGHCKRGDAVWGKAVFSDSLMYAGDFEGYLAYVVTSPTFFCDMFKTREEAG